MTRAVNPVIRALLRSRAHGLLSRWLALISVTGRRTGRQRIVVVNYRLVDDRVEIASRAGHRWWRNLQDGAAVTVRLRGRERRGWAVAAAAGDQVRVTVALQAGPLPA